MTTVALRTPTRALLALMAGILAISAGAWVSTRHSAASTSPRASAAVPRSAAIEDQYGVRVLGAYLTAAGGMVEIQYQVLDADKAAALGNEDESPVIEAHGTLFDTPGLAGHGHAHQAVEAGRNGFVLLANTEGGLHAGDTVGVRIGDLVLEDVVLE